MFARQNPGKRRVRFPDEVVFEDEVKEQESVHRSSVRAATIFVDLNLW